MDFTYLGPDRCFILESIILEEGMTDGIAHEIVQPNRADDFQGVGILNIVNTMRAI